MSVVGGRRMRNQIFLIRSERIPLPRQNAFVITILVLHLRDLRISRRPCDVVASVAFRSVFRDDTIDVPILTLIVRNQLQKRLMNRPDFEVVQSLFASI